MKNLPGLALLLCVGGVSHTAFAADPPAPAAAQPAPVAAPAPMAADATVESTASQPSAVATSLNSAPAASAADADAAKAAAAKAEEKKYRNQGYKPRIANGETHWCKSDTAVGSRLPTTTCYTAAQLDYLAQQGQDSIRDLQRSMNTQPNGH